jgi:hypothetical protein
MKTEVPNILPFIIMRFLCGKLLVITLLSSYTMLIVEENIIFYVEYSELSFSLHFFP